MDGWALIYSWTTTCTFGFGIGGIFFFFMQMFLVAKVRFFAFYCPLSMLQGATMHDCFKNGLHVVRDDASHMHPVPRGVCRRFEVHLFPVRGSQRKIRLLSVRFRQVLAVEFCRATALVREQTTVRIPQRDS